MRRLALHASALSDEEYDLYTSSLRDIALADDDDASRNSGKVNGGNNDDDGFLEGLTIGVREARAWLRGRYPHISASIIDSILRLFSPSLAHGDTLSGEEFFAVLRLVIHAESGKPVDRSLAFVQASPSKPSNAQVSLSRGTSAPATSRGSSPAKHYSELPPPMPSRKPPMSSTSEVSAPNAVPLAHHAHVHPQPPLHSSQRSESSKSTSQQQQHSPYNPFVTDKKPTLQSKSDDKSNRLPPLPPRKPPPPVPGMDGLVNHLRNHADEPFAVFCYCGESFPYVGLLDIHANFVHYDQPVRNKEMMQRLHFLRYTIGAARQNILPQGDEILDSTTMYCRAYQTSGPCHGLIACWAGPLEAACLIRTLSDEIAAAFKAHQIGPSEYAAYAGFDLSLIYEGTGCLQQVHLFTSVDISPTSDLIPELGKLFFPLSSIILTPSMRIRLPVFKGDGTAWDFDDYAASIATKWSDRGEMGCFNPTIIDLTVEARPNAEGGMQDADAGHSAPGGDDRSFSNNVPSREGGDRKDKKEQADPSDGRGGDGGGGGEDGGAGRGAGGGSGGPGRGDEGSGDGGGGSGDDPKDSEAKAAEGPCSVSYKVTSKLYSDEKKEIFQILKSEGNISIQVEENPESRTYKVDFRNLKQVSACDADVAAPFEQSYMQVTIDSRREHTNIKHVKPLPTRDSESERKVVETTKNTRTIATSIAAALSLPIKATWNGSYSHARERGRTEEHKRYTSRITTSDISGVVWWGFNVDDANQRQEGLRLLEGHENLPSATLTYKLPQEGAEDERPKGEVYGSVRNPKLPSATEPIDIEVASYWSLISEGKTLSLDTILKLINGANKNREHVPYSNLIYFVVLTIPPKPHPKSNYEATMVFQNQYKTPTLLHYELSEKEGDVDVFEGVRRNEGGYAGHSGNSQRKTMLSLPSLHHVPLEQEFVVPGQRSSQSSKASLNSQSTVYTAAPEGDDKAKNVNVEEVEPLPAQAKGLINVEGGNVYRLELPPDSGKA